MMISREPEENPYVEIDYQRWLAFWINYVKRKPNDVYAQEMLKNMTQDPLSYKRKWCMRGVLSYNIRLENDLLITEKLTSIERDLSSLNKTDYTVSLAYLFRTFNFMAPFLQGIYFDLHDRTVRKIENITSNKSTIQSLMNNLSIESEQLLNQATEAINTFNATRKSERCEEMMIYTSSCKNREQQCRIGAKAICESAVDMTLQDARSLQALAKQRKSPVAKYLIARIILSMTKAYE